MSIRDVIHIKNSIYLFTKPTGQEPVSLLTRFRNWNARIPPKNGQDLHQNFESLKIFYFLSFSVSIRHIFQKTAPIFTEKRTGQQIFALLNAFNILIYDLQQKFDNNCIKTLTSRDRPKSVPYPRLKNSKRTSKRQFTVLEKSKNQKMDRVARRGLLARAPGALKGGHFRNCQQFCRS